MRPGTILVIGKTLVKRGGRPIAITYSGGARVAIVLRPRPTTLTSKRGAPFELADLDERTKAKHFNLYDE